MHGRRLRGRCESEQAGMREMMWTCERFLSHAEWGVCTLIIIEHYFKFVKGETGIGGSQQQVCWEWRRMWAEGAM